MISLLLAIEGAWVAWLSSVLGTNACNVPAPQSKALDR
jgi:hypothetical protein